jgi:co-chaperonin GroES (HSP10)
MIITESVRPIKDYVFVEMEALQEKITFKKSGATIYLPSYLERERYATVQAVVNSVGPLSKLGLNPGDTVACDYRIVSDYEWIGDTPRYNRCYRIGDKTVWKADNFMISGVFKDGKWNAIGEWVYLKEIKHTQEYQTSLQLPTEMMTKTKEGCATFISGDLPIPEGATVYFNEKFRNTYQFPDGEEYIIMDRQFILAWCEQ